MAMKNNLKKGASELLILKLLSQKDMYGYEIKREIEARSQGLFTILEGSLYPILSRLTQSGYLSEYKQESNRRLRIYYHMEEDGRYYFARCLREYQEISTGVYHALNRDFIAAPIIHLPDLSPTK